MSERQNIRQVEMRERIIEMLEMAISEVLTQARDEGKNPYDIELDTEEFLANYRILRSVGHYASLRYFKDFLKARIFVIEGNDSFKLHRRIAEKKLHGVKFPEDKKPKGTKKR